MSDQQVPVNLKITKCEMYCYMCNEKQVTLIVVYIHDALLFTLAPKNFIVLFHYMLIDNYP